MIKDRFDRELETLDLLISHQFELDKAGFEVPKIVDIWKDYHLLGISYLQGIPGYRLNLKEIQLYIELMQGFRLAKKFNLKDGIYSSLFDISYIPTIYQNRFEKARDIILDEIDWVNLSISMIHGDFHKDNLIQLKSNKIGIIDWEYASNGSIYFDLAYYEVMSKQKLPTSVSEQTKSWKSFVELILAHWHLSYYSDQPGNCEKWMRNLETFANI